MSSILLKSDLVVALDQEDRILKDGYLVVENDRIIEMGYKRIWTAAGNLTRSLN